MRTPAPFLTTVEVGRLAGVCPKTSLNAARAGDVPQPTRIGRSLVWLRSELPAVLAGLKRRAGRSNDPVVGLRRAERIDAIA